MKTMRHLLRFENFDFGRFNDPIDPTLDENGEKQDHYGQEEEEKEEEETENEEQVLQ